jgi:hypothetical protein
MFKSLTDFDALSNTWPIESDFLAKRPSLSTRVSIELSRELPWILPCRTSHFRTWSDGTPHKYCRCARSLSHWQACKRCTYCCLRFLSLTLSSARVRVCHVVSPLIHSFLLTIGLNAHCCTDRHLRFLWYEDHAHRRALWRRVSLQWTIEHGVFCGTGLLCIARHCCCKRSSVSLFVCFYFWYDEIL